MIISQQVACNIQAHAKNDILCLNESTGDRCRKWACGHRPRSKLHLHAKFHNLGQFVVSEQFIISQSVTHIAHSLIWSTGINNVLNWDFRARCITHHQWLHLFQPEKDVYRLDAQLTVTKHKRQLQYSRNTTRWTWWAASACCDLELWLLIPKSNQHIYEPKCTCQQNCVKFLSLVFEILCSQSFQWDANSLMDGHNRIQNASSSIVTVAQA